MSIDPNDVRKLLSNHLGRDVSEITDDKNLYDDLGADPLDIVEITISLEEMLGKEILDDDIIAIETVGQLVGFATGIYKRGAAQVAAEWWGARILNPKFDNGDDSPIGKRTAVMALMNSRAKTITRAQYKAFVVALEDLLQARIQEGHTYISVGVDYNPDELLSDAATKAGIPSSAFPWKTDMYITKESVDVSYGYAAPSVRIYPSGED